MSRSLLRLLLVALLALAVPFQGALAVGAAQCMAYHQQDAASHHADGHGHEAGAHDADGHGHGHDDAGAQHASQDSHADEGGDSGHHCGPCTACCASSVSISGDSPLATFAAAFAAVHPYTELPPLALLPSELDRPPLAL